MGRGGSIAFRNTTTTSPEFPGRSATVLGFSSGRMVVGDGGNGFTTAIDRRPSTQRRTMAAEDPETAITQSVQRAVGGEVNVDVGILGSVAVNVRNSGASRVAIGRAVDRAINEL